VPTGSGPAPGAPHHLHPPCRQPVGRQAPPPPAPAGPGRLRPGRLAGRQPGHADLPVRTGLPVPAAAGAGHLGPRRGRQATLPRLRPSAGVLARIIVDGRLAPANLSDLAVGEELLAGVVGWTLADGNYGSPGWPSSCRGKEGGCCPHLGQRRWRRRPPSWLIGKRRWVETVIGQLTSRYTSSGSGARDAWHLWSRWLRRLLSHPMAVLPCQRAVLGSLRFADLLTS
jgi:hypothetical protein